VRGDPLAVESLQSAPLVVSHGEGENALHPLLRPVSFPAQILVVLNHPLESGQNLFTVPPVVPVQFLAWESNPERQAEDHDLGVEKSLPPDRPHSLLVPGSLEETLSGAVEELHIHG